MMLETPSLFGPQYTANGFYFSVIMWVGICLLKILFLVKFGAYQVILLVQLEILLTKEMTHPCS